MISTRDVLFLALISKVLEDRQSDFQTYYLGFLKQKAQTNIYIEEL